MCGRYTLTTPVEELLAVFDVPEVGFAYRPRFNVAPTQEVPIVAGAGEHRKMGLLRWGLVPSWADDPSVGNRLINARSETAHQKPSFRDAFARRRCLVPADGFYEWTETDAGKRPFWIHRPDRRPFALAGLWERWEAKDRSDPEPLFTFTILTRDAVPSLRDIHPRMPVVLDEDAWDPWLDARSDVKTLRERVAAPPGTELLVRPVSTAVNRPENDGPECIEPVETP